MRPVDKGTDSPYTRKTTFQFKGANFTAVRKFIAPVSGNNFLISDCLNVWLDAVKGAPLPRGASMLDRKKAVSAIQYQVNQLYKTASVPMMQRLGPFCSYCESPLSGLAEVEHCMPKSNYPTYSTSWTNFLLSCGPCNTAKGNNPSRELATRWTGKTNPTERELYDEIRGMHFVWADIDDQAYDWMPHSLYYRNSDRWNKMSMKYAADTRNIVLSHDIETRTVCARIFKGSQSTKFSVFVAAESGTPGRTPDNGKETIALCNLNGVTNTTSTYDRRFLNRTIAWFTCLKSLNNYSQARGSKAEQVMWNQMLLTAVSTGFYSVWLSLIDYVIPDKAHQFVTDTNDPRGFPGTNTTELP